MITIFYIDPQGGSGNLGMYDYELLSRMSGQNIYFFGGKTYDYLPLSNIKGRFWFEYSKFKNNIFKGLSYVMTLLRILVMCVLKRPSIIHIQWIRIPNFDTRYYYLIKKLFKLKLVYTVHNILPHDSGRKEYKEYKKMYEICDYLIVHTNKTKEELIRDFDIKESHIFIAPHGPLNYITNEEETLNIMKSLKEKYDLNGKLIFSMLGYQSDYKGTDLLVEAWKESKILPKRKNIVLIIGGTNAKEYIKELEIPNAIVLDGFISDILFDAILKLSDVVLLPYRKIDQSGVLLTLVSRHKPYCTTDVGELKYPIVKENVGWVIPEISSKSIMETLEKIIENPNEIKQKSENTAGWERVAKAYDWNKAAKVTQMIYNEANQ